MAADTPVYHQSKEISGDEIQQILEMVRDMMGQMHHEASVSVDLNEMNISNKWAEEVKAMFSSPVKSSFEALQSFEKSIRELIHEQFLNFLKTQTDLIERVYLVSNNRLHYAIVLNEHTIENEAEIIEFKMNYDETPVSRKFPLILSFPDAEDLEGATLQEELTVG